MFEAYKIGIKLALMDGVTAGILALAGHFRNVSKEVDTLQGKLNRLKSVSALGIGAAVGGLGILAALRPSVHAAMDYQQRLARMQQMGFTPADMAAAQRAAWGVTRGTPTASSVDALDAIMHLRMVLGHTTDAIKVLPTVLRMEGVLTNAGLRGDQSYEVAKTIEMLGKSQNPATFGIYANAITKGIVASGGKVQASDYLSAIKYGRAAAQGWNKDFIEFYLPTLIQEMKQKGGMNSATGGPGNPLMSMYAAIVQGTIPQKALSTWNKLGLVDLHKAVWTKSHMMRGLEPGGIHGWQTFMANPVDWVQKYMMPALVKAGYTTPAAQKQIISYLFTNRTASFMAMQMGEQYWKFQRDRRLIENTHGINNYAQLMRISPAMQDEAIHKRFEDLKRVVGLGLVPILLNVLPHLISFLQRVIDLGRSHPTAFKDFAIFFGALGILLSVGGAITSMAASIGIIALAFPVLAAGAVALAAPLGVVTAALVGLAGVAYGFYKLYHWFNTPHAGVVHHPFQGFNGGNVFTHSLAAAPTGDSHLSDGDLGAMVAFGVAAKNTVIHNHLHIDGKEVAQVVTKHQARELEKPNPGANQPRWGMTFGNSSMAAGTF